MHRRDQQPHVPRRRGGQRTTHHQRLAHESLWREYPTDQRGSYFRQFWDVSGFFNFQNLSNEALTKP